jgi:hypothetical protein
MFTCLLCSNAVHGSTPSHAASSEPVGDRPAVGAVPGSSAGRAGTGHVSRDVSQDVSHS